MTEQEAIDVLTGCQDLLWRIEASGEGIYYRPTVEDRPIVEGIMHVCTAYSGYEHELTLDQLRRRAGLSPSGWGLVRGMVEQCALSLPGVAERRMEELRCHFGPDRGLGGEADEDHRLL
jgi:hypothetical protein